MFEQDLLGSDANQLVLRAKGRWLSRARGWHGRREVLLHQVPAPGFKNSHDLCQK